ncbi:hypothetical protein ACR9FH_003925, partial [Escherichia coli]
VNRKKNPVAPLWGSPYRGTSTSFITDSRKMITVKQNRQQISLLFVIVRHCSQSFNEMCGQLCGQFLGF